MIDAHIPLYSQEAEMAALGSMLFGERYALEVASKVTEHDFYRPANAQIFNAAMSAKSDLDVLTLGAELNRRGIMAEIGGEEYLLRLVESVPSATNAGGYAQIVQEYSVLRQIALASEQIDSIARDPYMELTEKVAKAQEALVKAIKESTKGRLISPESIDFATPRSRKASKFPAINDATNGGYVCGQIAFVGARSGGGKSAFAANECLHALNNGERCIYAMFADLEARDLGTRLIGMDAGVRIYYAEEFVMHMANGADIQGPKVEELTQAWNKFRNHDVWNPWDVSFFDAAVHGDDVLSFVSFIRACHLERPIDRVFVDYSQRIGCSAEKTLVEKQKRVSHELQKMARSMPDTSVMVLAQLNENGELQWGTAQNQDSALTINLEREKGSDSAKATIRKNRYGTEGVEFDLHFNPSAWLFEQVI